ncbi:hypothetical protein Ab1vBOLIVR6_gp121 [Agrobacterium phage OLIVR6]|nr:hypothetical protein Ab1vBOLIVR6_gp121 [Agrobacterium phage OLIVR6]
MSRFDAASASVRRSRRSVADLLPVIVFKIPPFKP